METTQRHEFNFVVGFICKNGRLIDGCTVYNPEKTIQLKVDHGKPVTLPRCAEILQKSRALSGRDIVMIKITHSIYSKTPDNEYGDFPEECYLDKEIHYDSRDNSMLIFENGKPVYANDDGKICRDQAALYDSM